MLRLLVAALLVANLVYWAWHWPPLAQALNLPADSDRQPERLARQVHAEQIRLVALSAADGSAAPGGSLTDAPQVADAAVGSGPRAADDALCLQSEALDDAGLVAARRELAAAGVPADAWVDMRRERPGSVGLVMGRFTDQAQARQKLDELRNLGVSAELLSTGGPQGLAPGLILGRFPAQDAAQARLRELQGKGVHTARVMTLSPPGTEHTLRVDRTTRTQQTRLLAGPAASAAAANRVLWHACAAP